MTDLPSDDELRALLEKATPMHVVETPHGDLACHSILSADAEDELRRHAPALAREVLRLHERDCRRANTSTHYEGCWRYHLDCAVERIAELEEEIARLGAEVDRLEQVELDAYHAGIERDLAEP